MVSLAARFSNLAVGPVSLCLKSVSEVHIKTLYGLHKPFDFSRLNWRFGCLFKPGQTAVRISAIFAALIATLAPATATTLLQLGLPEMSQVSTAIARVRVTGANAVLRGTDVYTVYRFETLETLKKTSGEAVATVAVPGGTAAGIHQVVAGAPVLEAGREYVLFLWTSRSGLTQVVGLTQGLFIVESGASKQPRVLRGAADEQMLDASGRAVRPVPVDMPLAELKSQVARALGPSRAQISRAQAAAVGSR